MGSSLLESLSGLLFYVRVADHFGDLEGPECRELPILSAPAQPGDMNAYKRLGDPEEVFNVRRNRGPIAQMVGSILGRTRVSWSGPYTGV